MNSHRTAVLFAMLAGGLAISSAMAEGITDPIGNRVRLGWMVDWGIRIPGGSYPAVTPTYVMRRPDGQYAMYSSLGDGSSYADTGYSTCSDHNGFIWSAPTPVMTHGGNGFDDVSAVISDIVTLPDGHYRAYCDGKQSNQGLAPTSIFYADSTDGVSWSKGSVLFSGDTSVGEVGSPRVLSSAGGYVMYFSRGTSVQRTTSIDGLSWAAPQTVIAGGVDGGFDIAPITEGGYTLYAATASGTIGSLMSPDGLNWTWDSGDRLIPLQFGISGNLGSPVVADLYSYVEMYVAGCPDASGSLSNIYSATGGGYIPEPMTLSLLALGGLALLRRKP